MDGRRVRRFLGRELAPGLMALGLLLEFAGSVELWRAEGVFHGSTARSLETSLEILGRSTALSLAGSLCIMVSVALLLRFHLSLWNPPWDPSRLRWRRRVSDASLLFAGILLLAAILPLAPAASLGVLFATLGLAAAACLGTAVFLLVRGVGREVRRGG